MVYFNVFAFKIVTQFCSYFLTFFIEAIKKMSWVAGVVITQNVDHLPAGKSTPDFIRKLMAMAFQEGQ